MKLFLNTEKQRKNHQENVPMITRWYSFDSFHADKYILFRSLTTIKKHIYISDLNKKNHDKHSKFDLIYWLSINNGEFCFSKFRKTNTLEIMKIQ